MEQIAIFYDKSLLVRNFNLDVKLRQIQYRKSSVISELNIVQKRKMLVPSTSEDPQLVSEIRLLLPIW